MERLLNHHIATLAPLHENADNNDMLCRSPCHRDRQMNEKVFKQSELSKYETLKINMSCGILASDLVALQV